MANDIPIKAPESLAALGVGPPGRPSGSDQDAGPREGGQPGQVEGTASMDQVVSGLNQLVQNLHRNLQFSIDDESGQTVIKVIDNETQEVVRQIPSEEIMRLRRRLEEASGVLFQSAV